MKNKLLRTFIVRIEAIDPLNEETPYMRMDIPYLLERPGDTEIRDQLRDVTGRYPNAHVKATVIEEYSLSDQ